jgi:hypothetical protein
MNPQPKSGLTPSRLRRRRSGRLARQERANKARARRRDRRCRFPLCPCAGYGLALEVSHLVHKGMGGDPTGERSQPEGMVLLCHWRHKESRWSIDKGTLRWRPLTDRGADGLIAWDIKAMGHWLELAKEVPPCGIDRTDLAGGAVLDFLTEELTRHWG